MTDPWSDLRVGLEEILSKIVSGRTDDVRLGIQLNELLNSLSAQKGMPVPEFVLEFCFDLVERVLADSLGFRASMLARLACTVSCWAGAEPHAVTGLCATHLMRLNEDEGALRTLEMDLERTPDDGAIEYRLIAALRAKCLERLGRQKDADQRVAEYEFSYQPLPGDRVTIEILVSGAFAAAAVSNNQSAERRAYLALSIFQEAKAKDESNSLVERLLPRLSYGRLFAVYGQAIRQSGDILRAIEQFQQGREEAASEGDASGAAICLSEIGITWERAGEHERGANLLRHAAEEAEACGMPDMAARWRKEKVIDSEGRRSLRGFDGLAYVAHQLNSGQKAPGEDAEAIVKKIILEARDGNSAELESIARDGLAELYSKRGQFNQAINQVKVAIHIADGRNDPWTGMRLRAHLANIAFRADHLMEAETAAREALDRAIDFTRNAGASEVRQAAAVAVMNASEVLFVSWSIEVLMPKGVVRPPNPNKLIELSQLVRSRNFDRWMALTNWAQGNEAREIFRVAHRLIEAEIAVEAAAQAGAPMGEPVNLLDQATKAFLEGYPAVGRRLLDGDQKPGLEEVLDRISGNDIVLDLNPVESGLICIVGGKHRVVESFMIPWKREERLKWAEDWRVLSDGNRYRSNRRRSRVRSGASGDLSDSEVQRLVQTALTKLDEHFVRPLCEHLGPNPGRLFCATHSELFGIPFWALTRGAPDLVLSVLPSLTTIPLLANRPKSSGTRSIKIGDATHTLAMVPKELAALATFDEIEPDRGTVARSVSGARRIHFAGHGDFEETNPYMSGIVIRGQLSPPYAVTDPDKDCVRLTLQGLMRDWDMRDCELAVLSACSTGIPRSHGASEFTSLSTTLLLTGTRNVVAASWPADDVATMLLMSEFYRALEQLNSPAHALANARKSLSTMDRETAAALVQRDEWLPVGERPFSCAIFTDTFVHVGID